MVKKSKKTPAKSVSSFWLDDDLFGDYLNEIIKDEVDDTPDGEIMDFSVDLIELASARRVISNFVNIHTGQDVPVKYISSGDNLTDGRVVYLSSTVRNRADFDWCVGLALHEGTHVIKSDWDFVKKVYNQVTSEVKTKARVKGVTIEQVTHLCKWLFNVVEDRFIDTWTFDESPGYRGYYKAMYERFWNSDEISKALQSKMYRIPNFAGYEFRVINLTNPATDLTALPGLKDIAEEMDITHIRRLETSQDRYNVANKIALIILDHIVTDGDEISDQQGTNDTVKHISDIFDKFFDSGNDKDENKNEKTESKESSDGKNENKESKEQSDKDGKDVKSDDAGNSKPQKGKTSDKIDQDDPGDTSEFNKAELNRLKKQIEIQRSALRRDHSDTKEAISPTDSKILDLIEQTGITLEPVGENLDPVGNKAKVNCIVVHKLTKELIQSNSTIFPLTCYNVFGSTGSGRYADYVNKGFVLGKTLGKKLQIRNELNVTKYIHRQSGKIHRRLLANIGAGLEDIFYRSRVDKFDKIRVHISIDASSSMDLEQKWGPTLTCVVAICVACSMVGNLAVSVSFRTTHNTTNGELPYVVLAYDSEKDKLTKIKSLFPFLHPSGCTPEGLTFEATMDKFIVGKKTDDQEHYFLNISDGEPFYSIPSQLNQYGISFNYTGPAGVQHTKQQIQKIKDRGVKVMSYFIDDPRFNVNQYHTHYACQPPNSSSKSHLQVQFEEMYGKDAKIINVTNVMEISKTLNELFLMRT
jgi:hypothetical protein